VSAARAIAGIARADLLERLRRRSTLVLLASTLLCGWWVHTGALGVEVGGWRGVYDSAWVGMMMTLIVTTLLGLVGFYLVKDPIARDRQTGVGQIVAATPVSTASYLTGKWLSSTGVLLLVLGVLGVAAMAMQLLHGEAPLRPVVLAAPLLLVAVPALALVAAMALLFETVPVLRGGGGNVAWFFLFLFGLWAGIELLGHRAPAFDPIGAGIFMPSLRTAVSALDPGYQGGFTIGGGGDRAALRTFTWPGIEWTGGIVLARLSLLLAAAAIAIVPSLWFDRFDAPPASARRRPAGWVRGQEALARLTGRMGLVGAELRMLLAGQPAWWILGFVGVALAGLVNPEVLVLGWLWPLAAWSALGCRAERDGTLPLLLSTPGGVARPVLAAWGAGALLAAIAGLGTLVRSLPDPVALAAFAAGCALVPALALACGVWSRGPRLFEVIWLFLWYLGSLNHAPGLDVARTRSPLVISAWLAAATGLLALAVAGRARSRRSARGG
jgi:hypothetical protein